MIIAPDNMALCYSGHLLTGQDVFKVLSPFLDSTLEPPSGTARCDASLCAH